MNGVAVCRGDTASSLSGMRPRARHHMAGCVSWCMSVVITSKISLVLLQLLWHHMSYKLNTHREKKKTLWRAPVLHSTMPTANVPFWRYMRPSSHLSQTVSLIDIFTLALIKSSLLWSLVKPPADKKGRVHSLNFKYVQLVITAVFQIDSIWKPSI